MAAEGGSSLPNGGRATDLRFHCISCLLLLLLIVGGTLLVLYLTLPPSPSTDWLSPAGMIVTAIPWLFWLVTFLYRSLLHGPPPHEGIELPPGPLWAASASPPLSCAASADKQRDSSDDTKRVRSAVAPTVMDIDVQAPAVTVTATGFDMEQPHARGDDDEGFSHTSETPLAFAMAS